MNKLILALGILALLVAAAPDSALAQGKYAQTNLDSLAGIRGRTITDGFGAYEVITTARHGIDLRRLVKKTLWAYMPGKTDSLRVQGGTITTVNVRSNGTKVFDTTWTTVPVKDLVPKRAIVPGQGTFHHQIDTIYTDWVSDVGVDRGAYRQLELVGPEYNVYRITTGINDSTAVKYRFTGRKDD